MPVYGESSPYDPPQSLSSGRYQAIWDDEEVALSPPEAAYSVAVGLHRNPNLPNVLSVEIQFAEDPGAFAVELQVADTDLDEFYVTKATLNTGLNAAFVGRIEATNIVAKFARLKMTTFTNPCNVTAKIF